MSALRTFRALPRFTSTIPSRTFSATTAAANYARMSIIGRLGNTPEPMQTSTGQTVYRYAVAMNHGPRDNQQTSWFNISTFIEDTDRGAARAQLLGSLEKGSLVFVEADSRMGSYDDQEGRTHKVLNLTQRSFQVLARPNRTAAPEDVES